MTAGVWYTLDDDRNPVACDAKTFEKAVRDVDKRRVGLDRLAPETVVSTVFLGIDHNFSGKGPPLLFETQVVLNGELDTQVRYATWDEAEKGHAEAVAAVKESHA